MKKSFILLFAVIWLLNGQSSFSQEYPLDELEKKLREGEKSALFKIAKYLSSKRRFVWFLGHHIIEDTESIVAQTILQENSLFTTKEIGDYEQLTSKKFLDFLNANNDKIVFSPLAQAFLITPLELRTVRVEFREVSNHKKKELQEKYQFLLEQEWVKEAKIDSLILKKNPMALLKIASELYRIRYRININGGTHHRTQKHYIELLQALTGIEIAVGGEENELNWHIDTAFYHKVSLNLLIYFASNYSKFEWNPQTSLFVNKEIQVKSIEEEFVLFQLLSSQKDSVALDAFIQLTTANYEKVIQFADEFEKGDKTENYSIPSFPYRFLRQIVVFTTYCKQNDIDFTGSEGLKLAIKRLTKDLSFKERRVLEDSLIQNLSLAQITAFEYWAMIYEKEWELTYSAGRILDIFYSKNWKELLQDDKQLKWFLKKSYLFDNIGIIGICNNYLKKFTGLGDDVKKRLASLKNIDEDMLRQIKRATAFCNQKVQPTKDTQKFNDANRDYEIPNLTKKIEEITKIAEQEEMEDKMIELLSKISYVQIGEALKAIENIEFKENSRGKYSFMERDWGFFIENNFDEPQTRVHFLTLYDKMSEYELYAYYLNKAGIDYKNPDNSLNYDKIFDILKYNVVTAFVGGGGGKDDNEVYAIIKLLELTHNTTLGYPKKLCNSNDMYACSAQERTNEWMQFLITHKLLKKTHDEPVSFHYEQNK